MKFDKIYSKLTTEKLDNRQGKFTKIVLSTGYYQKDWIVKIKHKSKMLFRARITGLEQIGLIDIDEKLARCDSDCTVDELREFLIYTYGFYKIRKQGLTKISMQCIGGQRERLKKMENKKLCQKDQKYPAQTRQ